MSRNKIRFATRKSGMVIFSIGFIFIVLTSSSFFTEKSGADSVNVKNLTYSEQHLNWPPLLGVAVMALGSSAYLMGVNRK